jgi:hypothetical protein
MCHTRQDDLSRSVRWEAMSLDDAGFVYSVTGTVYLTLSMHLVVLF